MLACCNSKQDSCDAQTLNANVPVPGCAKHPRQSWDGQTHLPFQPVGGSNGSNGSNGRKFSEAATADLEARLVLALRDPQEASAGESGGKGESDGAVCCLPI